VFDERHWVSGKPNIDVATEVDTDETRRYINRVLGF